MSEEEDFGDVWADWAGEDLLDDDPDYLDFGGGVGAPSGGMPFLQDVLQDPNATIVVDVGFGANIKSDPQQWNFFDITTDVRQAEGNKINISPMGRQDESSQAPTAGCTFQLDNTLGNYTKDHPGSKWWPFVRENTPVRVRLYVYGLFSLEFQGYITGWVPSWDISGNLAVVTVLANGILRRLNQGKTPLRSALYRAITLSAPSFYWAMEDGSQSTQPASSLPGGFPLSTIGTPTFAGGSGAAGSDNVVSFPSGGEFRSSIPAPSVLPSSLRAEFIFKFDTPVTFTVPLLTWDHRDGSTAYAQTAYFNGILYAGQFSTTYSSGGPGYITSTGVAITSGVWHHLRMEEATSGPNVTLTVTLDNIVVYTNFLAGVTLGSIGLIYVLRDNSLVGVSGVHAPVSAGHAAIWQPYSPPTLVDTYQAFIGYTGELAVTRLTRLGSEQGTPIQIIGSSDTLMGPQGVATEVAIYRECEATDGGLLYDGMGPGLTYITRRARYDIPTSIFLDMAADPPQVSDPFNPVDDDQRRRNIIKVDQKNGSSQIYEDFTGISGTNATGDYDSSVPVNYGVSADLMIPQLLSRAAWEVRKGTFRGFRYPKMSFDIAATPALARAWLSASLSARLDVLNVTSKATQHPPGIVSLVLEGYSTALSPFDWTVDGNCSPFEPNRVAVIESSVPEYAWRIESGSSTLHQDYPPGVTSILVDVADGYLWSTNPANYPRDLDIGGVQITATGTILNSNPYFESPLNATGWVAANGATIVANNGQAHDGLQSLLITPDGVSAVPQAQSDEIPVIAGHSHRLDGWIRGATGGDTLTLNVFWFDSAHNFLSSSAISAVPSSGVWTEYGPTSFIAPANGFARITTNNPGTPLASHTWRIDGVTLVDASSPQTFFVVSTPYALTAGSPVHLWRPAKLAL